VQVEGSVALYNDEDNERRMPARTSEMPDAKQKANANASLPPKEVQQDQSQALVYRANNCKETVSLMSITCD
jgi:hypothetical protein